MALAGGGDAGALAQGLRQEITGLGLRALAAKALHVAVRAPERLIDVYDNAAAGWFSNPVFPPRQRGAPPRFSPLPPTFWTAFWNLIESHEARSRLDVTNETIQMAALLPAELTARIAAAAADFPAATMAAAGGLPAPFRLTDLARCPNGSLGAALYQQVVLGRVDLQAIENEGAPLKGLPPPLDYFNLRIMQCYPLWRMVAGYDRGGLDDIGLAAFQMAQFGHHYSSLFVGIVLSSVALQRRPGLELVLETIFRGWTHGRETPCLLGAPWDTLWHLTLDEVRAELGVAPFNSPLGAALRMLGGEPPKT